MTRDEAVEIAKKAKEKWGGGSSEWWLVVALEALGVIELDEPHKTVSQKIDELSHLGNRGLFEWKAILHDAGLAIVDGKWADEHSPKGES